MKKAAHLIFALICGFVGAIEYDVGGPLEGPKLPLFPVQNGEPEGQPGCIPELAANGKISEDMGNIYREYTPQGQWPQSQLYPDSIENWRAYWFKYVPVRSMVDAASLLQNWKAPNLPGADAANAEQYAAPVYWVPRHATPVATGKFNKPVPAIRCNANGPVFDLDLGERPIGMYVVRVIGAVEGKHLGAFRQPLYVSMTVNDGNEGQENTYRLRCGFQDEFYSVAEIFFHAPAARRYHAKVRVDAGSTVDLLVHNIDLHDVLAGVTLRPIKQRMTLSTPEERALLRKQKLQPKAKIVTAIEDMNSRRAADEVLWNALPPMNVQIGGIYGVNHGYSEQAVFGANGKTMAQLEEEFGIWKPPAGLTLALIDNEKLTLSYTVADLAALKPLPDPYPIKDAGAGIFTAGAENQPAQNFTVVADAVVKRFNAYGLDLQRNATRYNDTGDVAAGWTAAVELCRLAWQFPSLEGPQTLGALITDPGGFSREMRCRRRDPSIGIGGASHGNLVDAYDSLFDLIKGNEPLAQSIGRFIPWIKTSDDVIMLLDCYLVQYAAKRILRYNYLSDNAPTMIVRPAAVLGDRSVTDPWLEWLFAKAYIYPNPPAGLGNVIVTGNSREGVGYIASWSYCLGEQAARNGQLLEAYVKAGGNPQYDVTNAQRFPKVTEAAYWIAFRSRIAGLQFPRIGDVGGPDKGYGFRFDDSVGIATSGWQWTKDPAFAFMLKHFRGRQDETDEEWVQIEQAAAKQPRAPWLQNRSRVLPNWFGVLESGVQHDDFRFRRSAMVRIGQGYGHQHADTLDLQITAHGLPMTIDAGQRVGYSKPGDSTTRVHNLVEVDGKSWLGHAWIRSLSDVEGARYLLAEATPPPTHPNVNSCRRQVALLDVDKGAGLKPLAPAALRPDAKLDKQVATPNSYVFDVVRVSGGKVHTYCFHGALEDELATNVLDQKPYEELPPAEQDYLQMFRPQPIENYPMQPLRYGGNAPDRLEATWRMATEIPGNGYGQKEMAPGIWDASVPRLFTRLHLFGQKGARVLTGWAWCRQWSYGFNNLLTQRSSENESSAVFPAIIEPFAGKPFITECKLLDIPGNDTDAARAVAVEVKTANGRVDICFADGHPEKPRRVGELTVSGEFAFVSRDNDGLREAALTAGTQLVTPDVALRPAARERTAKVVSVDYLARRCTIDQPWPAGTLLNDSAFEVGQPEHMTTYMLTGVADDGKTLGLQGGADLYRSGILAVDSDKREVHCVLGMPFLASTPCPGINKQLVASNDDRSKFWRAEYTGRVEDPGGLKRYIFRLDAPVAAADFSNGVFRLWEYGVGDSLRQSTFAGLRRVEPNVFELTANVDVVVGLKGAALEIRAGDDWKALATRENAGILEAAIAISDLPPSGSVQLRVKAR